MFTLFILKFLLVVYFPSICWRLRNRKRSSVFWFTSNPWDIRGCARLKPEAGNSNSVSPWWHCWSSCAITSRKWERCEAPQPPDCTVWAAEGGYLLAHCHLPLLPSELPPSSQACFWESWLSSRWLRKDPAWEVWGSGLCTSWMIVQQARWLSRLRLSRGSV